MIDLQRIFHTGLVVHDIHESMAELGASLSLEWAPVRVFEGMNFWTPDTGLQPITVHATYSRQGPHHMEIVQGPKGGFYDPDLFPDGRHIGVYVDDLAGETNKLVAQGWKVVGAAAAPEDGYGILSYLTPPKTGFVIELVTADLKPIIDEWVSEGL